MCFSYKFNDLAFPQILNYLNATFYLQSKDAIMKGLLYLAIGLFVMYVIRSICRYYVSAQGHIMGSRMESDMRQELFDQFERLSFSYYDENNTGEMMSKLVSDLFDISEFAHHGPENIFISLLKIFGSFLLLLYIHVPLTIYSYDCNHLHVIVLFSTKQKNAGNLYG